MDNKKAPLKANNNFKFLRCAGFKATTIKNPNSTLNMGSNIFNITKFYLKIITIRSEVAGLNLFSL